MVFELHSLAFCSVGEQRNGLPDHLAVIQLGWLTNMNGVVEYSQSLIPEIEPPMRHTNWGQEGWNGTRGTRPKF